MKEFYGVACKQGAQSGISFPEKVGHQEDQHREQESAAQGSHQAILDPPHGILHQVIHAGEIEGDESGKDSQQDIEGKAVHGKGLADGKGKHHLFTQQEIGDNGRGDR